MTGGLIPMVGRNILVISPQQWGVMHVSKHHYAVELARMGNKVYFLNPPKLDAGSPVEVVPHESMANLFLVNYRLFFPYNLRFHLRWLFDRLMRWQMRKVLAAIDVPLDIAWCFDTNLFADLRVFGAKKVVYHVADQIMSDSGVQAAASADLVVAVDQMLLGRLDGVAVPKIVVGHGLAEPFALLAEKRLVEDLFAPNENGPVQVGYVGNLFATSIDRKSFRRIIATNPEVIFHLWGPSSQSDSNVGSGATSDIFDFIEFLKGSPNVILHGVRQPDVLAQEIQGMDAFLICYDPRTDINGGCNTHKILEYLSTGKVVVSSHLSTYESYDRLVVMARKKDNSDLVELFLSAIQKIQKHNSNEMQIFRIKLAIVNKYAEQINIIIENLYTHSYVG